MAETLGAGACTLSARLKMLNKENRYRTFTGHCTEGNMSANELLIYMKANSSFIASLYVPMKALPRSTSS